MRINFLEKKGSLIKHRADLIFAVFLIVVLGTFHLVVNNDVTGKTGVLKERISFLQSEIQRNGKIKRKLKELKQIEAKVSEKSALLRMLKERKSVPPLVNYFAEKGTPKGVWLEELVISGQTTRIEGGSLDIPSLIKLIKELKQFGSFSLNGITKESVSFKELKRNVDYYKFSLKREGWR